jgi:hypothetical protein
MVQADILAEAFHSVPLGRPSGPPLRVKVLNTYLPAYIPLPGILLVSKGIRTKERYVRLIHE